MVNEWNEFLQYTDSMTYAASGKRDTRFLGRFTWDTLLDFEGLARILTVLARGFLFHLPDGSPADDPRSRIGYAKRALCAWCSIPDAQGASQKKDWQFETDFRALHGEFPALVDEDGGGWFWRHVRHVADFIECNPGLVTQAAEDKAQKIKKALTRRGGARFGSFRYRCTRAAPRVNGCSASTLFWRMRWRRGLCGRPT